MNIVNNAGSAASEIPTLKNLANAIGGELNVKLVAGARWEYDFKRKQLIYNVQQLAGLTFQQAKGLVYKNLGHCLYSQTNIKPSKASEETAKFVNKKLGRKAVSPESVKLLLRAAEDERAERRLRTKRYPGLKNGDLPRWDQGYRREFFLRKYTELQTPSPQGAVDKDGNSLYWVRVQTMVRGLVSGAMTMFDLPADMPWSEDLVNRIAAVGKMPTVDDNLRAWYHLTLDIASARPVVEVPEEPAPELPNLPGGGGSEGSSSERNEQGDDQDQEQDQDDDNPTWAKKADEPPEEGEGEEPDDNTEGFGEDEAGAENDPAPLDDDSFVSDEGEGLTEAPQPEPDEDDEDDEDEEDIEELEDEDEEESAHIADPEPEQCAECGEDIDDPDETGDKCTSCASEVEDAEDEDEDAEDEDDGPSAFDVDKVDGPDDEDGEDEDEYFDVDEEGEPSDELEEIRKKARENYTPPNPEGDIEDELGKDHDTGDELGLGNHGAGLADGTVDDTYRYVPSWSDVVSTVLPYISPIRKAIQQHLKDNEMVDKVRGYRSGRFDVKSAMSAQRNIHDRAYSRKSAKGQQSYAVHILVDTSSSMRDRVPGSSSYPEILGSQKAILKISEEIVGLRAEVAKWESKRQTANIKNHLAGAQAKLQRALEREARLIDGTAKEDDDWENLRDMQGNRLLMASRMCVAIAEAMRPFTEVEVGYSGFASSYIERRSSNRGGGQDCYDSASDTAYTRDEMGKYVFRKMTSEEMVRRYGQEVHSAHTLLKPQQRRLDAGFRHKILDWFLTHRNRGGTDILPALQELREEFKKSRALKKLLIILTDGEFGNQEQEIKDIVKALNNDGVELVALTVGTKPDDARKFLGDRNADEVTEATIGKVLANHFGRMVKA